MQGTTKIRAVTVALVAAAVGAIAPGVASAAPGDPAATQVSGQSLPTGAVPVGTQFLTGIDILASLDANGNLNGASRVAMVRNFQRPAGQPPQQFPLVVNPTCLSVKGREAFITGLSGSSPVAFRIVDNTNLPPGTAGETPDLMQLSFNIGGLELTRCTKADLLAPFNGDIRSFNITQGFAIVHEDEPRPSIPPREQGNTTQPLPPTVTPNPGLIQPVPINTGVLAPLAPVAQSPTVAPSIRPTSTATRRVCRRVVVRRNGRVVRNPRTGKARKRTVCRRVPVESASQR